MEIRDHLRLLRRSWALLVLGALLGALAGGAYAATRTPQYTATARAFVSVTSAASLADLATGVTAAQQAASGYAAVATTAYVLQPVAAGLNIGETPAQLAEQVAVTVADGSQVLDVVVTDASPQRAARIANAIVSRLSSASIGPAAESDTVRLAAIDPAVAPADPVGPPAVVPVIVGGLLGLLLLGGAAVLRASLDTRVRTRQDLERVTDVPVLGLTVRDSRIARHPLVVASDSDPSAEGYRTLRTNLRFVELDASTPSLLITSALQSEGKSITAANTALAMAALGRRVLLVDADLRRPAVASTFAVEGALGLSDVLVGAIALEDAVQPFGDSGLHLLPAGTVPPNPNEQLQSRAMRGLIDRLHREYDLVVFDTPPLLPVSDAVVLSAHVGAVLVVAASGRVRRPQLADALERLQRTGVRTAGLVLTMVPRSEPEGRVEAYRYGPAPRPSKRTAAAEAAPADRGGAPADVSRTNEPEEAAAASRPADVAAPPVVPPETGVPVLHPPLRHFMQPLGSEDTSDAVDDRLSTMPPPQVAPVVFDDLIEPPQQQEETRPAPTPLARPTRGLLRRRGAESSTPVRIPPPPGAGRTKR